MKQTQAPGAFKAVIEGPGYTIIGVPTTIENSSRADGDWEHEDWDSIRIRSSYDYTFTFPDGTVVDRVRAFTAFRLDKSEREAA